ncbi:hypothetical protein DERP_011608 [Dermatophagoides pteronyssinus]|uniref:Protein kinase domain-containing protein n=1 Tax=Dermatophagoides pteronyssinus TaxID=6956 RepID=A0ABQ8JWD5_DERPT|nr:hypothetical protein DERP_011608 [Dermatophagoides pteronyssinus]
MIDNNSYLKKFFDKNFHDNNHNQNHRTKRIETLLSIQCGTTEYMAPEILNQELQQQQQQQQMTAATTTLFNDTFPWCSYDPFRADIYSMGICLFEMLNYYRPFRWSSYNLNYINGGGAFGSYNQNHNNNNLVWQQRNRQYRYNKRIYLTEECRDLIDEMLEPRAAIRPTSRQVLDHRWFKYSIR